MAAILPQPFSFAKVSVAPAVQVPATALPTDGIGTFAVLPFANTRSVTILNTGGNVLLFGIWYAFDQTQWPTLWGGSGPNVAPAEGKNCARIPVGGSLTIEIGSFQERGNMGFPSTNAFDTAAPTLPDAVNFPFSVMWFGSLVGATTADITYVNRLGQF